VIVARDRAAGAAWRARRARASSCRRRLPETGARQGHALIVIDAARGRRQRVRVSRRAPARAAAAAGRAHRRAGGDRAGPRRRRRGRGGAARGAPCGRARLAPDDAALARWRGRRVLAFAGIGDPQRFVATLRAGGVDVTATRAFADHHRFSPEEIARLMADARAARCCS